MKNVMGLKRLLRSAVLLCISAMIVPIAQAQYQPNDFDVTDGQIQRAAGDRLMVSTKEMRATLKVPSQRDVTVNFSYLGPTEEISRLGSGAVRSQFGVKLRAQDTCNIVYVMWHFSPDQNIAVSVKRNPGMKTHEDCVDHGYINNIKPRISAPVPPIYTDRPHTLSAAMRGAILTVSADGSVVWEGNLGSVALEFDGPVGLRSDNAKVVFDFLTGR
ncbi:hypothetical protein AAKU64_004607 [Undibacterium sp. GrIS 1.8]|uniref:hypothetical protein n=1 Tax=Undibacterium sp. GrIS 1.8 TaxID=3143934 RepID=UPI003399BDEB